MDLSELERLENPAKVLKLSEAVRAFGYSNPVDPYCCVLGTAYKMTTGHETRDRPSHRLPSANYVAAVSELFNVPEAACRKAELMCMRDESPSVIADWLESKGY